MPYWNDDPVISMIRLIIYVSLLLFVAYGIGSCVNGESQAAPAFCDNHGVGYGQIYKAACAEAPED